MEGRGARVPRLASLLPATSVLLDATQCHKTFQERRVGVMPHGEQPVCHRKAQVVLVELDEG